MFEAWNSPSTEILVCKIGSIDLDVLDILCPTHVVPDTWAPAEEASVPASGTSILSVNGDLSILTDWQTDYFEREH